MKRHQKLLIAALVAVAVLQVLPFGGLLSLPFVYLNTHLHELCHAVVAVLTGGTPLQIQVYSDGSGITPIQGGWMIPVASAGYVGCALIGGAMIFAGRTSKGAHRVFLLTAIAMSASLLLFVRGDGIGIVSGVFWCAVLWISTAKLTGEAAVFGAQFMGALQCLNALQSFGALLHLSRVSQEAGDAAIMQQITGVPAVIWASFWTLLAVGILIYSLGRTWQNR